MSLSVRVPRSQSGLTLIELLISVAIGLVALSGLLVVYLGSRAAYVSGDSLARVQESGRFAVEFIAQDARMTGFMGCRSRNLSEADQSLINITSPAVPFTGAGDAVRGFDGSNSSSIGLWVNPSTATRVGASDVITIRRASGQMVGIVANSDPVARTVTIRHNAVGLSSGDLAVLINCEQALLFYVTNDPPTTGVGNFPTVLQYGATGGGPSGTLGNDTGIPVPSFKVASRAEVMRVVETSYFIGQHSAGRPSLFRASGGVVEELVDNVEDMDILYGLADSDSVVTDYRRADQIAAADWGRVVSARVSLLVVGPADNVTTGVQTYRFRESTGDGVADEQTAPDRRLRQVFTTTISLRNRAL